MAIGSIPSELGYISSLKELYLGLNQLTGTIPSTIFSITLLNLIDLHSNSLTGVCIYMYIVVYVWYIVVCVWYEINKQSIL